MNNRQHTRALLGAGLFIAGLASWIVAAVRFRESNVGGVLGIIGLVVMIAGATFWPYGSRDG